MLQHDLSVSKIGADTAENERYFAENLPKICQKLAIYPTGEVAEDRRGLVAWAVRFSQLKHSGAHFSDYLLRSEVNNFEK